MLNLHPFLNIGVKTPVFHAVGNTPEVMEMLNSFVSTVDKAHDDNLSILLVMLSFPVEEEHFSELRAFVTLSSETAVNKKGSY